MEYVHVQKVGPVRYLFIRRNPTQPVEKPEHPLKRGGGERDKVGGSRRAKRISWGSTWTGAKTTRRKKAEPLIGRESGLSVATAMSVPQMVTGQHRVQPTLFAMQVALEASMRAYGVRPGAPGNFFTTTPP